MGENFKKFLLLFLGCVIGLGGFSALSRDFKDDEKDKKPAQEETVSVFDALDNPNGGYVALNDPNTVTDLRDTYIRVYASGTYAVSFVPFEGEERFGISFAAPDKIGEKESLESHDEAATRYYIKDRSSVRCVEESGKFEAEEEEHDYAYYQDYYIGDSLILTNIETGEDIEISPSAVEIQYVYGAVVFVKE